MNSYLTQFFEETKWYRWCIVRIQKQQQMTNPPSWRGFFERKNHAKMADWSSAVVSADWSSAVVSGFVRYTNDTTSSLQKTV
jgi:hypothetical protein